MAERVLAAHVGEGLTLDEREHIRAHYQRALPWLERHFGGTPVMFVTFPSGWTGDPVFHTSPTNIPKTIGTVDVRTSSGMHPYVRLNAHNVTWLCAAHTAVELDGWAPTLDDPQRAAFARLVLSPHGSVSEDDVFTAAHLIAERLAAEQLRAIPVLDGFRGLSLWIPFSDGPDYPHLSAWLGRFAADAVEAAPETFTIANLRADRGDRIYLGTRSNRPGMGTLLPYALRGTPALEISLPVSLGDLGKVRNGEVTAGGFAEYMRLFGDVFERERTRIKAQVFGSREISGGPVTMISVPRSSGSEPRNYIIACALAVLADGKPHDADDILAEGLKRGLLPQSTTRKYVYTALHEYVIRTIGAGRVPAFVQLEGPSATFRINEPADTWPDITLPPFPKWIPDAEVAALIARLRDAATGADPEEFEEAACAAFAALGFLATHIGGNGAPDGVLTAPLGTAAYRAVLECKTASPGGIVSNPRPEEAAKFREATGATISILLGPAFGADASLDGELRTHGVALWTVDDLTEALEEQIGPDEIRPMLEPGRSETARRSILWERNHGRRKRVAVIADRLARVAWRTQVTLASSVEIDQTPVLTEETMCVLVDEALAQEGIVAGARIDEVRDAILQLSMAGRLRAQGAGFVVRMPGVGLTPHPNIPSTNLVSR